MSTNEVGAEAPVDQRRASALQIRVFGLCALVALIDGMDNQSIGLVAPLMADDLGLNSTQMGVIFSVAQAGATLGALTFGHAADRFGRKPMIVAALAVITVFTWLTALCRSFDVLVAVRLVAGIGLAGAIPCLLALTSEFAPKHLRATMIGMIAAAYPLGAALGGFLNAYIMLRYDWRMVFYVGAVVPLGIAVLISLFLPESPQYLRLRQSNRGAAERVGRVVDSQAHGNRPSKPSAARTVRDSLMMLFANGLAATTLLLWCFYFFAFATTKIMVVWFPTLLSTAGFSVSIAAIAQACFNIGCTVGMAGAGGLIDKFGASRTLVPALVTGAMGIFLLGIPTHSSVMFGLAVAIGVLIGIGASGAHVIAASSYPVEVRSTGIGWGMASSRVGQVVSPMLVALMLSANLGSGSVYSTVASLPLFAGVMVLLLGWQARASATR